MQPVLADVHRFRPETFGASRELFAERLMENNPDGFCFASGLGSFVPPVSAVANGGDDSLGIREYHAAGCPPAPQSAANAVMVNLLASADGPGAPQGLAEALRVEGAHLHIYGKTRSGPGRKMGHITALGATLEEAHTVAQRAADCLRFGP